MDVLRRAAMVVVAAVFISPAQAIAFSEASSQASFQAPQGFSSLLPMDYSGYGYFPSQDLSFFYTPYAVEPLTSTSVSGRIMNYGNNLYGNGINYYGTGLNPYLTGAGYWGGYY